MSSLMKIAVGIALLIGCAGSFAAADELSSPRDVAPTGTLRVAVAVGPAASTFWATRDPPSGEARGATVGLAKAPAAKRHGRLRLGRGGGGSGGKGCVGGPWGGDRGFDGPCQRAAGCGGPR